MAKCRKEGKEMDAKKKEKNNSQRNKAINKAPLSLSLGVGVRRFCFEAIAPSASASVAPSPWCSPGGTSRARGRRCR